MNNKKLVTVIIPCFNMEHKISPLFESLLKQTSTDYVIYVIDDGSIDNSKNIIMSYVDRFNSIGVELNYVYQQNSGVAAAVNTGLKYVNTEFFCLPDADDYLENEYIEKCSGFLKSNLNCGIVFTECNVYHESDMKRPYTIFKRNDKFKSDNNKIIKDFIWGNNVYFSPNYMIRTKAFVSSNRSMEIFHNTRGGQNPQMIVPELVNCKIGYIDKPLYNYIHYRKSHSHEVFNTVQNILNRLEIDKGVWNNTIKGLNISSSSKTVFLKEVEQHFLVLKAQIAFDYGFMEIYSKCYAHIEAANSSKLSYKSGKIPPKIRKYFICIKRKLAESDFAYKVRIFLFANRIKLFG